MADEQTPPTPDPARGAEVVAMDRAHVFHSWSAQGALNPLPIAAAEGSYFWDYDGRRFLDFSSQLVNTNIGHQHPRVTAAIAAQAQKLCTIAPQHANEARGEACDIARLGHSAEPQQLSARAHLKRPADKAGHYQRSDPCGGNERSSPSFWSRHFGRHTHRIGADRLGDRRTGKV